MYYIIRLAQHCAAPDERPWEGGLIAFCYADDSRTVARTKQDKVCSIMKEVLLFNGCGSEET